MDKKDYHDKMNELVNDKQTYQELKRDPTPALQRKVNNKLLILNKLNAIDTRRYYRLRCSVPQAPKLYGVPKLHKPNTPMRPIVSHCGSPTYQLSKYLTTILQPLTNESRHKVQSTKDFIDIIKTVHIPDDHKLVSFDVKSLFTIFHFNWPWIAPRQPSRTRLTNYRYPKTTSWTYSNFA